MTEKTKIAGKVLGDNHFGNPEDYWSHVIDSIDDEITIIDRNFRIVEANARVLRRYNLKKSDVIGRPCFEISHDSTEPCHGSAHECPVLIAQQTGLPARCTHIHSLPHDLNAERHSDVMASPLRDARGEISGFVLIVRDVTEMKRLEEQTLQVKRNFLLLNDIISTMSQSLVLDTILNIALDKALALVKGKMGGVLLLDPKTNTLSYKVFRGLSTHFVKGINGLKLGEGLAGRAAALKEPVYSDDISSDGRVTRPVVAAEGLKAFVSIPLIARDKVLGVMNLMTRDERGFSPENITLINSISSQVAVAIENAVLYKEVREKEESRRELLRQMISNEEQQRKRIARGLHDEVSQSLTGLAFKLAAVGSAMRGADKQVRAKLQEVQALAASMQDEIHRVVYELRPSLLDDLGLIAAVQWLSDNHLEENGIQVSFSTDCRLRPNGTEPQLSPQTEIALFRIAQEAITNIVRHANARRVKLRLEFKEKSVALSVEDDGEGFAPEKVPVSPETGRGFGLLGMKERAELLSGTLTIDSQPGAGTRIHAEIPT